MTIEPGLRAALADPALFSRAFWPRAAMRPYQAALARAVAAAVVGRDPAPFAAAFSRQAGKDETLVQLIAYLMVRMSQRGGNIVVAAPTLTPQATITRDRLIQRLRQNPLTAGRARLQDGYIVRAGNVAARFLSAAPGANARGQTADLLLVANEAQDIDPGRWDSVFAPMTASTNATTLYLGTVWDRNGLLHRQMEHARLLAAQDARQRLFLAPWRTVAADVPAYAAHVRDRIAQLGPDHPFVKTEYELVALDAEAGLFPPER
ncbi:MAG TPA: hypothetical protein PKE32_05690, partial [Miltoncostaeaceae bacterium]|nr:hypothetical protein [Miltoncostaeaceae bacterium]